ncbi:MAG: hypothetical protein SGI99_09040 [Pseudomonadota bacterium]|nr:hypothetical protein [Pseudomonadota bacterium]
MKLSQVQAFDLAIATALCAGSVQAAPACDERIHPANPDRVPFQWIVG